MVLPSLDALFGAKDFDPLTAQESYRLALSDYSVAAFGAALARRIRANSPGSTLAYLIARRRILDHLSTGTIDLLILGGPAPRSFSTHLLFTDHFVCAVAADHKLARRRQISRARLPALSAHQHRYRARARSTSSNAPSAVPET